MTIIPHSTVQYLVRGLVGDEKSSHSAEVIIVAGNAEEALAAVTKYGVTRVDGLHRSLSEKAYILPHE